MPENRDFPYEPPHDPNAPPGWYEKFFVVYLRDFSLLPVTIAVLTHLAMALGVFMLNIARGGVSGYGGLILFAMLTWAPISVELKRGRPGIVTFAFGMSWLGAGAVCWLGVRTGIF